MPLVMAHSANPGLGRAGRILAEAIVPAFDLLPGRLDTAEARVLMLAIGLQESRLEQRVQLLDGGRRGPARGLWQFERGGGGRGVLRHARTQALAVALLAERGVAPNVDQAWRALEHDDVLAAGFARLLLLSDPAPLPAIGDVEGSWSYYERTWRPGKPHPKTWPANYRVAVQVVGG